MHLCAVRVKTPPTIFSLARAMAISSRNAVTPVCRKQKPRVKPTDFKKLPLFAFDGIFASGA